MFSGLMTRVAGVLMVGLALLIGVGCSADAEFAKAAGPLADQVASEVRAYGAREPDQATRDRVTARANELAATVQAGDRATARSLWFGEPPGEGVRELYLGYLATDPAMASGDGPIVRRVLAGVVTDLDSTMRLGVKQANAP